MNALIILAAVAAGPTLADGLIVRQRADVLEMNHVYDAQGRLIFVQLLPRRWEQYQGECGHWIVTWRVMDDSASPPSPCGAGWQALASGGTAILVYSAPTLSKTWTQYDVELVERSRRPRSQRSSIAAADAGRSVTSR